MIHHGNEQVQEDDDVDDWKAAEHDEAPEPGELLDPGQLEVVQVYQAKRGPEKGLRCLPEAVMRKVSYFRVVNTSRRVNTNFANFRYARQWFISITIWSSLSYTAWRKK